MVADVRLPLSGQRGNCLLGPFMCSDTKRVFANWQREWRPDTGPVASACRRVITSLDGEHKVERSPVGGLIEPPHRPPVLWEAGGRRRGLQAWMRWSTDCSLSLSVSHIYRACIRAFEMKCNYFSSTRHHGLHHSVLHHSEKKSWLWK